ncbi:hypothetical protein VNI00_017193 [Paramarasmius palmivorus]|uniref:Nephrocystin 3-like N-terminal domain-containing protein n=1 Tax=Paramarasmius palmivorus TaxID=297713 RepID=A0AAW0B6W7_9AGAR
MRRSVCHRLAAAFFFSRNDPTRDKLDSFVPTIIYQLLNSEPLRTILSPSIFKAIRLDPNIFQKSFEHQFRKLILEPCSMVDPQEWENLPNLVVIDGLDECIAISSQERLIAMIRDAILTGCPLIFLISSRPEPRIRLAFEHEAFASVLGHLVVGNSYESTQDIAMYLRDRFTQLQHTHHALRHLDFLWPGEDVVRRLVARACGQFIFAVTVMKYLDNDEELPSDRLEAILRIQAGDLPESPYPDLDLLYHQILVTCRNWDKVRQILQLLVTPHYPLPAYGGSSHHSLCWRSSRVLATLLKFQPGEVESLLIKLHSVVEVPNGDYDVQILHYSFADYLMDHGRSGACHVEPLTEPGYLDLVAQATLRYMLSHSQQYLRTYTLVGWQATLYDRLVNIFLLILAIQSPSDELLATLDQFDPYYFAALLLNSGDGRYHFLRWKDAINWARSLGVRAPKAFLEKMQLFMQKFCVGSRYASEFELNAARAYLESVLYTDPPRNLEWGSTYLQELLYPRSSTVVWGSHLYVIPVNGQTPRFWNGGFRAVFVTRERSETIKRLLQSLNCDPEDIANDICNDTFRSVNNDGDAVKHNDLYSLKRLVAQRRTELGHRAFSSTLPRHVESTFNPRILSGRPGYFQFANPSNQQGGQPSQQGTHIQQNAWQYGQPNPITRGQSSLMWRDHFGPALGALSSHQLSGIASTQEGRATPTWGVRSNMPLQGPSASTWQGQYYPISGQDSSTPSVSWQPNPIGGAQHTPQFDPVMTSGDQVDSTRGWQNDTAWGEQHVSARGWPSDSTWVEQYEVRMSEGDYPDSIAGGHAFKHPDTLLLWPLRVEPSQNGWHMGYKSIRKSGAKYISEFVLSSTSATTSQIDQDSERGGFPITNQSASILRRNIPSCNRRTLLDSGQRERGFIPAPSNRYPKRSKG